MACDHICNFFSRICNNLPHHCNARYDCSIGGILSINMGGGSIIMHEASHTHDKLGAASDFYEPNLTQGLF